MSGDRQDHPTNWPDVVVAALSALLLLGLLWLCLGGGRR